MNTMFGQSDRLLYSISWGCLQRKLRWLRADAQFGIFTALAAAHEAEMLLKKLRSAIAHLDALYLQRLCSGAAGMCQVTPTTCMPSPNRCNRGLSSAHLALWLGVRA